jgi:uncharacterized protein YndB with AHSA1/START domain
MPREDKLKNAIRRSIQVDCEIEDAFRLFTEGFEAWWPLALYSVEGENARTCVIEPWTGGRVYERSRSGEEHEWGTVTNWDPPNRISFRWHPGRTDNRDDERVDVRFDVAACGTRVTVIHSGWDTAGVAVSSVQGASGELFPTLVQKCFVEFANAQVPVMI